MSQCSICFNEVKQTRNNTLVRCGHVFHSECLSKWKEKGHNTCPLCRKVFDVSNFKIVVTVYNNYESTSNALSLTSEREIFNVLDTFELSFDVDNVPDLDEILSDLGMSLSNFDPAVLHTE